MEVYIDKECWDKIINYAKAAYHTEKCEIGGMSVVTQDKDGDWLIQEPVILKQEIGNTTCDLDKEELAKYYTKMAVKYKDINFRFCWWHSHHTMGAFWSGTDLSSIDEYGEGESDLSFALVVNLKEEYKCRISVWKPVEIHQDVELNIIDNTPNVEIPLEIVTEVKAKCETRNYVYDKNTMIRSNNDKTLQLWGENNYNVEEIPTQQEIINFEEKFEYACSKITEFIRQVNSGDWNMHKFKTAIKYTNQLLKPYGIEIESLNKREFKEFLEMGSEPYELVTADQKFIEIAESLIDAMSYNSGYGGYGI